MPEGCPFNFILYRAMRHGAFDGDELPFLKSLDELREIPPGIDEMPFVAGFVVSLVVLPALLGCDLKDDVLAVVLRDFILVIVAGEGCRRAFCITVSFQDIHALDETVLDGVDVPQLGVRELIAFEILDELVNLDFSLAVLAVDHFKDVYVRVEIGPLTGPILA
jgi:hypothetical protein